MSATRLLFLTSGPTIPSTQYRILPYLSRLQACGFECDLCHSFPQKYHKLFWLGWRGSHLLRKMFRIYDLMKARLRHYDIIILEREIFDDPTDRFEYAFRHTTARMILDVDDAIFLRYPEKFERIVQMCDHVMAGNRLLAEECQKAGTDVTVIPTSIDLNCYSANKVLRHHEIPVIGWIGTAANIPNLQMALPALKQLAHNYQFVLRVITSHEQAVQPLLGKGVQVAFRRWSAETAIEEINDFDIGIMPLQNEQWERYKCGFKLLQYMAASIPAVTSPVGVNEEIVNDGINGYLAKSQQEWTERLGQLLKDGDLAHRIGRAGRQTVEQTYSIDIQLPRVISVLTGVRNESIES